MSEPSSSNNKSPLQGALNELISAMSALNMQPEPIPGAAEDAYLSESDKWAKHSMEHLNACFRQLSYIMEEKHGS